MQAYASIYVCYLCVLYLSTDLFMKTVVSITYVFRYAMPPFQVGKSNQQSICMFNYVHTLLLCSIYTLKGLYDIYGF
jgi:hypothetical protein